MKKFDSPEEAVEYRACEARERRDMFAACALMGLLAKYGDYSPKETTARLSCEFADALIAAIDKPVPP